MLLSCEKIINNLARTKDRIRNAMKPHQNSASLTMTTRTPHLVIVTKTRPIEYLTCLLKKGYRHFGENYVQEAIKKDQALKSEHPQLPQPAWELIGPLQRNKVRKALQLFWRIHTLDRESLARKISNVADEIGKEAVPLLIQVNIDGTKNGIEPDEVIGFVDAIKHLPHLELQGLMCIAPMASDREIRDSFISLRNLREQVRKEHPELQQSFVHLSMGMTNDFEIAIQEGATIVRIGKAIFSD